MPTQIISIKEYRKSIDTDKIFNIFLCFIIYSFTGWIIETIYMSIYHGHFVKRGFLLEPLCVVYGIGTILVIYFLAFLKSSPIVLFLCSSLVTTFLEFITGLGLQNFFNKKLWDYSEKHANLMGLVCLQNTLFWGILSLLVVYVIHPVLIKFFVSIPYKTKEIICSSVFICLLLDIAISAYSSIMGFDSITLASHVLLRRLEYLSNATYKVVYYISH